MRAAIIVRRSTMVAATCVPGDPAIQADRYFVTAGSVIDHVRSSVHGQKKVQDRNLYGRLERCGNRPAAPSNQ
jgi:hypothetical protein